MLSLVSGRGASKQGVHVLMCENVLVSHPVLCNKSMMVSGGG